jgi:ribonuclease E
MTKRMLIDATHAEETRVVVLDGNNLEDYDVESSARKQLKGNIYLAKVVRVEPSLQAAFVEYGGGRHGFLAFGEIHPDYYQIPVADRERLLALQAEEARADEDEDEDEEPASPAPPRPGFVPDTPAEPAGDIERAGDFAESEAPDAALEGEAPEHDSVEASTGDADPGPSAADSPDSFDEGPEPRWTPAQPTLISREERFGPVETAPEPDVPGGDLDAAEAVSASVEEPPDAAFTGAGAAEPAYDQPEEDQPAEESPDNDLDSGRFDVPTTIPEPPPELIGGEDGIGAEEVGAAQARARQTSRLLRTYRIQEVIHRRQVMLVQVVKEERGTKGAALTTYISLAGRFSVLMPNSPRGGGVSRKITSAADRKRLREVTAELDLPKGMGLIVRTAGANRPKPEIRRDCEYLMRLWDDIREHTLASVAPALIYEEASLIKRAIRDVYSRDIDEIIVDGEAGWRAAHEFMRQLMPSHAAKVKLWRGPEGQGGQPLLAKYQVEAQLEVMLSPTVQLKSGSYLVINQAEALVAIDVNSGRSTRERNIEETALRTNLEAADEIGRQLRLRDLAGLIVIDFIDMESRKHVAAVERRLKDALKDDRARIQVGHISHFGLMEMSRQRLRPSLAETSLDVCPHCAGSGRVRSADGSAISVLRAIEDEGAKGRAAVLMVHAHSSVVMFLLNHKRERLAEIEVRYGMRVQFAMDDALPPGQARIDRVRAKTTEETRPPAAPVPVVPVPPIDADAVDDGEDEEEDEEIAAAAGEEGERAATTGEATTAEDSERRRKRRRRRRGRRDSGAPEAAEPTPPPETTPVSAVAEDGIVAADTPEMLPVDALGAEQPNVEVSELEYDTTRPAARRRGRRGPRRGRNEGEAEPATEPAAAPPPYTGPTPADPFAGGVGIFDLLDTAEPPQPRPASNRLSEPALLEAEPEPASEPQASAEPQAAEPQPQPELQLPREPEIGPAIQPVMIGQDVPVVEPKRGWWRR